LQFVIIIYYEIKILVPKVLKVVRIMHAGRMRNWTLDKNIIHTTMHIKCKELKFKMLTINNKIIRHLLD